MEALARHVIEPIVSHPDDVAIQVIEGDDVTILELVVHPDDRAVFDAEDGRALRAVRTLLSAAAGRSKATIELVDSFSDEE